MNWRSWLRADPEAIPETSGYELPPSRPRWLTTLLFAGVVFIAAWVAHLFRQTAQWVVEWYADEPDVVAVAVTVGFEVEELVLVDVEVIVLVRVAEVVVVLVALADGRLHERIELTWDFDDHCVEGTYTLGDDDGQDWCAAGGAVRGCACCGPYGCPRGHFLRTTYRSGSDSDAPAEPEEDLWAP